MIEIIAVSVGMVLFALFAHQRLPWIALGAVGLIVVAATIGASLRRLSHPAELLGLNGVPRHSGFSFLAAAVIGASAGMLHRYSLGLPLLPAGGLELFATVACLIGAAEELLYRGWLQGKARVLGMPAAIVIAAASHATYKTALFAWSTEPIAIDYAGFALWTVIVGIVLGLLRAYSQSVLPAVFAHAAFDFVVYGAVAAAPWWVWS